MGEIFCENMRNITRPLLEQSEEKGILKHKIQGSPAQFSPMKQFVI